MSRNYVTYFDCNYAIKGLAMINSLQKHDPGAAIYVLCLDKETFSILAMLRKNNVIPVKLETLEAGDSGLALAKTNRTNVEYYWTLTPTLMLRFLQNLPEGAPLTYVDADLLFFSSLEPVFQELGSASVLIHGHNFPPDYSWLASNGLYNVGLVSVRNDKDGIKVLQWWRERCNEWCYNRCENGKMGDQKYLESFAGITDKLAVAKNPGIGVGPWNCMGYKLGKNNGIPCVNGTEVIFYHYHSAALLLPEAMAPCTDLSYPESSMALELFAIPYLKSLNKAYLQIRKINPEFIKGFTDFNSIDERACLVIKKNLTHKFILSYPCIIPLDDEYCACASPQFAEGLKMCEPIVVAGNISWTGNYPAWQDAEKAAYGGYDKTEIFESMLQIAKAMRNGDSLPEIYKSSCFHEKWNWQLLASLFKAASLNGNKLHVLDFGGAFGNTYIQNMSAFYGLEEFTWNIVEQKHFIDAGKKELASDILKFYSTLEEAMENAPVNVILLSGVLQYLPEPYKLLNKIVKTRLPVIIERTFCLPDKDRICVQNVPENTYLASYPCWWLNKMRIASIFENAGYLLSPWYQSSLDDFDGCMGVFAQPVKKTAKENIEVIDGRIRVLQADDFYPAYLKNFYDARPALALKSSAEQSKALFEDAFSAVHAFTAYLPKDKFLTEQTVCQALPQQRAWAIENGQSFPEPGTDWQIEMLKKRIRHFKPDVLFLSDPVRLDGNFLSSLAFKPKLVMGWKAADIPFSANLTGYDIIFSGLPKLLAFAERQGAKKGIMFKPGMPEWLAKKVAGAPKTVDVCFAGSISPLQHVNRLAMLDAVSKAAAAHGFSLALYLNCNPAYATEAMKPFLRPPVFGLAMNKALASAKLVIDDRANHGVIMPDGSKKIDLGGEDTINMRMFEATGSGSLLLTQKLKGVERYFTPGKEVDTWENFEDLISKIIFWLSHNKEREQITKAGYARCLADHSMAKVAAELEKIIYNELGRKAM